jgi:hypothetical protein
VWTSVSPYPEPAQIAGKCISAIAPPAAAAAAVTVVRVLRLPIVRELRLAVVTSAPPTAAAQGLTLVHFSAQLERFVWD